MEEEQNCNDTCETCGAPIRREGQSLHVWDIEYECGRRIWGAVYSDQVNVEAECPLYEKPDDTIKQIPTFPV